MKSLTKYISEALVNRKVNSNKPDEIKVDKELEKYGFTGKFMEDLLKRADNFDWSKDIIGIETKVDHNIPKFICYLKDDTKLNSIILGWFLNHNVKEPESIFHDYREENDCLSCVINTVWMKATNTKAELV